MNTGITDATGKLHEVTFFEAGKVIDQSTTFDVNDFSGTYLIATDALVQTLPPVGVETAPFGAKLTFINSGADGTAIITLSPDANDAIFGTISNAAADSVSGGVDDKDFVNTKATANQGDRITLMSNGVSGWFITEGVGIWASEA